MMSQNAHGHSIWGTLILSQNCEHGEFCVNALDSLIQSIHWLGMWKRYFGTCILNIAMLLYAILNNFRCFFYRRAMASKDSRIEGDIGALSTMAYSKKAYARSL